jgi:hypothetical protein
MHFCECSQNLSLPAPSSEIQENISRGMAQEIDVLVNCVLKIIQATMGEMLVNLTDALFAQNTHGILTELWQPVANGRMELEGRTCSVDLHQAVGLAAQHPLAYGGIHREVLAMLRYILAALAAFVLLIVCLIPDDAEARRGGGAYRGGGGYRGGAVAVRGPRGGGAVAVRGAGYRGYGYRGGYRGYGYRGYGVGAAAVGAAALGTAAYRRSCYDAYGNYICAY